MKLEREVSKQTQIIEPNLPDVLIFPPSIPAEYASKLDGVSCDGSWTPSQGLRT